MSRRMLLAAAASAALHVAVLAATVGGARPGREGEPVHRGVAIAIVWSTGGGGERIGGPSDDPPLAAMAAAARTEPFLRQSGSAEITTQTEDPPQAEPAAETNRPEAAPEPLRLAVLPLPPLPPEQPPARPPGKRSESAAVSPAVLGATPSFAGTAAKAGDGPFPGLGHPGGATAGRLSATRPSSVGHKVDPAYPVEARRNRWQGTVVLAVTISPHGIPTAVEVARSSGYPLLDRSAVEAMWQWRFDPARRGGVAVEDRIAIPITFRLID